jgi:hypothetical protein
VIATSPADFHGLQTNKRREVTNSWKADSHVLEKKKRYKFHLESLLLEEAILNGREN